HPLERVAASLWLRRSHEPVRTAVVAESLDDVVAGLDAVADGALAPGVVTGSVLPGAADGAVWVFSGHGSHWAGMGRQLLVDEPAFAAVID
ncbi:acyltransferase domain-containing protein, partial [Mycolicibacterium elephantis]